ncbi:MAG: endonuclease/exonuclease/phosphatase family protein [Tepidisphaeraceae bacterium]
MKRVSQLSLVLVLWTGIVRAETVTLATYNIEHFANHFLAHRLGTTRPAVLPHDPAVADLLQEMRNANDKANWITAQTILDPGFNPDVLVIEEGCDQSDLNRFNKTWLKNAYATAIVFPSNTTRGQTLCLLAKPGFKILERKDQYYLEPDSAKNERGERLFARGPSFVLIETPSGFKLWVGVTHQKSKSGNNAEVTAWRNREAKRTHEIIKELENQGPANVVLLGDMNDELGIQEFEQEGGGDVIANLVGPPSDGLILATKPLADSGAISFGGYWRPDFRSFIDHIIVTAALKDRVEEVKVFTDGLARASSDHYPVMIKIKTD